MTHGSEFGHGNVTNPRLKTSHEGAARVWHFQPRVVLFLCLTNKGVRRILVRGSMPLAAWGEENLENLITKWCILKYIWINNYVVIIAQFSTPACPDCSQNKTWTWAQWYHLLQVHFVAVVNWSGHVFTTHAFWSGSPGVRTSLSLQGPYMWIVHKNS